MDSEVADGHQGSYLFRDPRGSARNFRVELPRLGALIERSVQ
jgi:hypothetical protein